MTKYFNIDDITNIREKYMDIKEIKNKMFYLICLDRRKD